ncbi:Protein of unknown function [Pyronema omphalodes CBS 100304]|uniref:Uncharacterized protein n=1 Tax=Pyronema omphalodes (strain CBS 100304) TaxID=1076935 RepID=U4LL33_PYROM|nr:Protein of unknown function [Pyronema omphalodes CBS 100304]
MYGKSVNGKWRWGGNRGMWQTSNNMKRLQ